MASVPNNFASKPPGHGFRIDRRPGLVEARFDSDPAHLAAVRTAIESLCEEAGFDAKATGEIGLVVNEAVANIIRHAYGSASDQPIQMRAEVKENGKESELQISLRDWGIGKLPAKLPTGLGKPQPADPMTPGGLGLVCMHNMMDQILFTPQPRGMLLTMRRKRVP